LYDSHIFEEEGRQGTEKGSQETEDRSQEMEGGRQEGVLKFQQVKYVWNLYS